MSVELQAHAESALMREMLKGERLRIVYWVAVVLLMVAVVLVEHLLFPEIYQPIFQQQSGLAWIIGIGGGLVLYEIFVWRLLRRFTQTKSRLALITRYLNSVEEITLPTLGLLAMVSVYSPSEALLSPFVLFYFVLIALSAFRLDLWLSIFTGLVAAVEYVGLALFVLRSDESQPAMFSLLSHPAYYLDWGGILILTGVVTGLVALQIKRRVVTVIVAAEERNRIVRRFGQHVSREVAERLLDEQAEVRDEVRQICVMFLDIRNFTRYSEKLPPAEVIGHLNRLFAFMIEIISHHHGIVNKFLGDGLMAVFGAPIVRDRYCDDAVLAALAILERLEDEIAAGAIPPTHVGIGLHAGQAVVGLVGSSQREEYTVIGDVVNLASRIEQLNKHYDSSLLISEAVWQALSLEHCGHGTSLGQVPIRGHEAPVHLYRLA